MLGPTSRSFSRRPSSRPRYVTSTKTSLPIGSHGTSPALRLTPRGQPASLRPWAPATGSDRASTATSIPGSAPTTRPARAPSRSGRTSSASTRSASAATASSTRSWSRAGSIATTSAPRRTASRTCRRPAACSSSPTTRASSRSTASSSAARCFLEPIRRASSARWSSTSCRRVPFVSLPVRRAGARSPARRRTAGACSPTRRPSSCSPRARAASRSRSRSATSSQDFGHGFMRLALETGTPIVPVAVIGAEEQAPAINIKPLAQPARRAGLPGRALPAVRPADPAAGQVPALLRRADAASTAIPTTTTRCSTTKVKQVVAPRSSR